MREPLHVAVNKSINYSFAFIFRKQHFFVESKEITYFTMFAVVRSIVGEQTVTTILTLA